MNNDNVRLLIVDDELPIRTGLKLGVDWNSIGISEVFTARTGEEAFQLCVDFHIELVLADIRMPGMSGLDFISRLNYSPLKVIFMSGYADFEYAQRALRLGAVDYLLKPVDITHLLSLVSGLVDEITAQRKGKSVFSDDQTTGLERHQRLFGKNSNLDLSLNHFSPTVLRTFEYINLHYAQLSSIDEVSQYVEKSKNYLSSHFKKSTGISLVDYLNRVRIERAKKLLSSTNMMIYEIAEQVGYSDYKYFSTIFKQNIGVTPGEYRNGK